jgi:hypothetical protein
MDPMSIPWMKDEYEALVNDFQRKTEVLGTCLRATLYNKNPTRTALGAKLDFLGAELRSW